MTTAGGGRSKAAANSITHDLIQFYDATPQSSKDSFAGISKLLNISNLVKYIKAEKCNEPTTITEKILRLKLAVRYITNLTNKKDYYITGCKVLKFLTKKIQSLSQEVSHLIIQKSLCNLNDVAITTKTSELLMPLICRVS